MNPSTTAFPALAGLLQTFTEGDRLDRVSLSRLGIKPREFFSDSFESAARVHPSGITAFRSHAGLLALTRLIWDLVPPCVFDFSQPDLREEAFECLKSRFGSVAGLESAALHFSIVLKRLRAFKRDGRRGTSLNLESREQRQIMDSQFNRCNLCMYEFALDYYRYSIEEDGIPSEPYIPIDGEISLVKTLRKPELDHIIPILFGGDSPKNWQILCSSCNQGKSDYLTYFYGVQSRQGMRLDDLFNLSTGKRYAVICETRLLGNVELTPGDNKIFRIFKKDESRFCNFENLIAKYQ